MDSESEKMIIKLSKSKIILLTLGSIGFVFVGAWMWTLEGAGASRDTLFIKLISLTSIIFFGMTGLYGLTKIFDRKPGLIINQEGLFDNSSAVGAHLIKWEDIKGFDIVQVKSTKFLLIFVHNPNSYLDKVNKLKRFLMKMNEKMYGTPLSISANSLDCNFDELIEIVNEKIKNYSAQQRL